MTVYFSLFADSEMCPFPFSVFLNPILKRKDIYVLPFSYIQKSSNNKVEFSLQSHFFREGTALKDKEVFSLLGQKSLVGKSCHTYVINQTSSCWPPNQWCFNFPVVDVLSWMLCSSISKIRIRLYAHVIPLIKMIMVIAIFTVNMEDHKVLIIWLKQLCLGANFISWGKYSKWTHPTDAILSARK